jgi:hypothetical protein
MMGAGDVNIKGENLDGGEGICYFEGGYEVR